MPLTPSKLLSSIFNRFKKKSTVDTTITESSDEPNWSKEELLKIFGKKIQASSSAEDSSTNTPDPSISATEMPIGDLQLSTSCLDTDAQLNENRTPLSTTTNIMADVDFSPVEANVQENDAYEITPENRRRTRSTLRQLGKKR
jgi:hypothetical protein